jgi:hypothetical protein
MNVELNYTPLCDKGDLKAEIVARCDGTPLHRAKVNLSSDRARQRFGNEILKVTSDISAESIGAELLRVADEVQALRNAPRATDPVPENETAKIEQFDPLTLDRARAVFDKWLTLDDPTVLDVILGTILAHRLKGDPLWLFLVGPPGGVKTELLRAFSPHPGVFAVSTLSPSALISGYITEAADPSLLPKLDGRVLVIKDFTAILQMQREARQEVISTLRDAYDGEACKVFGTGETKSYRSRFGVVAATTPVLDEYSSINAMLGERFLRYRVGTGETLAKIDRAICNATSEDTMRSELSRAACGVLVREAATPSVPDAIAKRLKHLANFLATARSEVARDRAGTVTYRPVPEIGTRVGKQLKKLALGIGMARGLSVIDDDVYRLVVRVALDSLPSMRALILTELWALRANFQQTANIAEACELDTETCRRWLSDLRLLGIMEREIGSRNAHSWRLTDSFVRDTSVAWVWPDSPNMPTLSDFAPPGEAGSKSPTTVGCGVGVGPQQIEIGDPDVFDVSPKASPGGPEDNGQDCHDDDSDALERRAIQEIERAAAVADLSNARWAEAT